MFSEKNLGKVTVNQSINTKELPFVKLKDKLGSSVKIFGYFFTNGDYGKQLVCVTKTELINMPNRYVEVFENWSDDEREAIINGKLILSNIREYVSKSGRASVIFDYADAE